MDAVDAAPVVPPVPTQVAHPWRTTVRSTVWGIIAAAAILPSLAVTAGISTQTGGVVATVLLVASAVTRVAASPLVTAFLQQHVAWLAPAPPTAEQAAGAHRAA